MVRFVQLSHRYGIASPEAVADLCVRTGDRVVDEMWRARHHPQRSALADQHPDTGRCTCPGPSIERRRCADEAETASGLCDACRQHCFGRRVDGRMVPLTEALG